MTGNISYLSDFKEINGGYVAFGGNPKGGKITDKATKDETSTILKTFITNIENQINHKVKIVRSDNGTEFKNHDLNQFCGIKVIKREFSVARTPQRNRVTERKNKTLIEAARTMLADSLLPIPFWDEAINTACYVQNKVLVTKPHNKTPYELLLGKTQSIGFMRPFGCPVNLGKFDGKANEGFLVGYSVSSKAFRVFNSRTRIVQETLHINFLENQPNVAQIRPKWLFDIDTLIQSMNYQPVVTGNQPNSSADPQNIDADVAFDVKENESTVHVSPSSSDKPKKHDEKAKREAKGKSLVDFTPVTTVGPNSTNSTNSFNVAGPFDNALSLNFEIGGKSSFVDPSQYPDDPNMPALKDIIYSDDDEDVGAEAVFSNLETSIAVNPILTTRVYKDHPVTQIIGDLSLAPQTKCMTRMVKEQGHTQEEGIYYEKVFAPFARIEDIRLFLAYASFMGFMVYQMDVKKAFLYGTIEEEVYVCQPIGFEDPNYPAKVYKVVKALYGLHQTPRSWITSKAKELCKYVVEILKKFGLIDDKSASTPIDTKKPLLKDPNGEDVDVHIYRKQTGVATSSTEAEYVVAASYCAQCMSAKRTAWNEFSSSMASTVICLATGRCGD
nr:hypothetical protein [Tanacetum cinerariifolium]